MNKQIEDDYRRFLSDLNNDENEIEYAQKRKKYQLNKTLKKLRQSWDIPQVKMAGLMGVSQRSYAGYENGERSVPSEALIELAVRTNVDLNELFTGEKGRVGPEYNQSIAMKTVEILNLIESQYPKFSEERQLKLLMNFIRSFVPSEGVAVLSDAQLVELWAQNELEDEERDYRKE